MNDLNTLSPREAAYIAHNAYFTLKDWVTGTPTAGMEKTSTVKRMVTGNGIAQSGSGDGFNTSLRATGLKGADLRTVFRGETAGLSTGFGYVLSFRRNGLDHVVVASAARASNTRWPTAWPTCTRPSPLISGMTAIDLFAAALSRGIDRYAAGNPQLLAGLQIAAVWAKVAVVGMKFTAAVIKAIMVRMMQVIKPLMNEALAMVGAGGPMPLVIAGATAIAGHVIA